MAVEQELPSGCFK